MKKWYNNDLKMRLLVLLSDPPSRAPYQLSFLNKPQSPVMKAAQTIPSIGRSTVRAIATQTTIEGRLGLTREHKSIGMECLPTH
jgi:hypothetical protein